MFLVAEVMPLTIDRIEGEKKLIILHMCSTFYMHNPYIRFQWQLGVQQKLLLF